MDLQHFWGPSSGSQFDISLKAPDPWGLFKAYLLVADAVTVGVPAATSAPILFNPANSGVVLKILNAAWGVTGGTIIVGAEEYALIDNFAYTTLTAGPNPINANFNRGNAFRALWSKAMTGGTVATVILPYGANAGGANAAGPRSVEVFPDLNIYLWPGQAFLPCVASSALAATVIPRVDFVQMPLNQAQ